MSALYAIRFLGQVGIGMGAVYIGKNIIAGIDVAGGKYDGSYAERNGRLIANLTLSFPMGGHLVTGQQLPPGSVVPLSADWPTDFANGQPQTISVLGRTVQVTFEKIKDIP